MGQHRGGGGGDQRGQGVQLLFGGLAGQPGGQCVGAGWWRPGGGWWSARTGSGPGCCWRAWRARAAALIGAGDQGGLVVGQGGVEQGQAVLGGDRGQPRCGEAGLIARAQMRGHPDGVCQ